MTLRNLKVLPDAGRTYFAAALVLLAGIAVMYPWWDMVQGSTVTVSATVGSSVTCSTDNTSVSFGSMTTGSVATANPNASTTMSCNTGLGCTLNISDANHGMATTSPSYTIPSTSGSISAGTEGYGIRATTTAIGSGATLGVPALYNRSGNNIGALNTTSTILASSTASVSNREIVVTHLAAIGATTQNGNYSDTITYSCTGN